MTRYGVASAQIWTESYVGAHHFSAKLDLTRSGLTPPLCLVHFHSWYSRAGFCPWGPTHSLWKDHKGQDRIQSHAFYLSNYYLRQQREKTDLIFSKRQKSHVTTRDRRLFAASLDCSVFWTCCQGWSSNCLIRLIRHAQPWKWYLHWNAGLIHSIQ